MSFKINVLATIEQNVVRLDWYMLHYHRKTITTINFLIISTYD